MRERMLAAIDWFVPPQARTDAATFDRARIFAFGVGYDVNTSLLNKLATAHHGTAQYVEPDELPMWCPNRSRWRLRKVPSPARDRTVQSSNVLPSDIYLLPLSAERVLGCCFPLLANQTTSKVLRVELALFPPDPSRLTGAGLILVNPPWRLEAELKRLLPSLARVFGAAAGSGFRLDWLSGEK